MKKSLPSAAAASSAPVPAAPGASIAATILPAALGSAQTVLGG
jgi:hypothetical protein